jgi:GTP pyrophosphokinase
MAQPKKFDIAGFCELLAQYLGPQEGEAKLFWQALSFAVAAHQDQKRKSGEVYVSHPLEVALILVKDLGVRDPETLAAAVLHDTVEDVPDVTPEVIAEIFGQRVTEFVEGCTKISSFEGSRQDFYKTVHRKLFSGAAAHVEVMLIKLADRLHNLRTLDSMPKRKRQKIADETLDVYAPLAKVMGLYGIKRELYDLALMFKFPRQSHRVLVSIQQMAASAELAEIKNNLQQALDKAWITATVEASCKGLWAYYDQTTGLLDREIKSPINIIITVNTAQACYQALGIVNHHYPPIPRTIRDFIANPKTTGYQSLHARANIRGQNYLFKIRSREMRRAGRLGMLADWSSKKKAGASLEQNLQEMFDILGADEGLSYREMIAASGKKEIYTYTPKGDLFCLPAQSIVLDFAFKIHTDVGRRCIAGRVNKERVGPEHVLRDGDQVEILMQPGPVEFSPAIQQLCQTPKARSGLARMFRLRREALARDIGSSLVLQELKRYGIPKDVLEKEGMAALLGHFQVEDIDELFMSIGEDRLRLRELIQEIKNHLYADRVTLQPPTGALNRLLLTSLDPASMKFSRCCNPLPTEKGLFGLLSERGLSVHRRECTTFKSLGVQREDVVELRWLLKKTPLLKPQSLFVAEATRNRLMMMLAVAPNDLQVREIVALTSRPSHLNAWEITFQVPDLNVLKNALAHFAKAGIHHEFVLDI